MRRTRRMRKRRRWWWRQKQLVDLAIIKYNVFASKRTQSNIPRDHDDYSVTNYSLNLKD